MRLLQQANKGNQGITIVELLIASVLTVALGAAALKLTRGFSGFLAVSQRSEQRAAIAQMIQSNLQNPQAIQISATAGSGLSACVSPSDPADCIVSTPAAFTLRNTGFEIVAEEIGSFYNSSLFRCAAFSEKCSFKVTTRFTPSCSGPATCPVATAVRLSYRVEDLLTPPPYAASEGSAIYEVSAPPSGTTFRGFNVTECYRASFSPQSNTGWQTWEGLSVTKGGSAVAYASQTAITALDVKPTGSNGCVPDSGLYFQTSQPTWGLKCNAPYKKLDCRLSPLTTIPNIVNCGTIRCSGYFNQSGPNFICNTRTHDTDMMYPAILPGVNAESMCLTDDEELATGRTMEIVCCR